MVSHQGPRHGWLLSPKVPVRGDHLSRGPDVLAQQHDNPDASPPDYYIAKRYAEGIPHVFQAYYPILDEAAAALDRAGQLLSAHLASAARVTA